MKGILVGKLIIKGMEVGMLGTNCYLVMDAGTHDGFVIDPGAEARKITEAAGAAGLACKAILCTHGHMDHVGAVGKVADSLGVPVMISRADSAVLQGAARGIGGRLSSAMVSKPKAGAISFLEPGEALEFGSHTMKVVATPGHSPGSMSFITGNNIFCGDLVFQDSIGRTDLRGGSLADLLESVRKQVWVLPGDTTIYPGHGPVTTVRAEKARNPYLRDLEPEV